MEIAAVGRQYRRWDEGVLVFDSDWSAEIAFYSERRTLMVPNWAPAETIAHILRDTRSATGSAEPGAVVYCPDMLGIYPQLPEQIHDFLAGLPVFGAPGASS